MVESSEPGSGPAPAPPGDDGAMAAFQEMLDFTSKLMPIGLLCTVATLRVPDAIGDRTLSVGEIAAATGAHAAGLRRILRIMVAHGIFERANDAPDGQARFANNAHSNVFRKDAPLSLWGMGRFWLDCIPMWSKVPEWLLISDGTEEERAPFDLFHGKVFWQFLEEHPDCLEAFNHTMSGLAQPRMAVIASLDASIASAEGAVICDVGSANGDLLVPLLDARPTATGVLFDLKQVTSQAEELLQEGSIPLAKHKDRVSVAPGDFFEPETLPRGAALYLLCFIVHDWSDKNVKKILSNVASVMHPDAWLVAVDAVMPEVDAHNHIAAYDASMLAMLPGAKERSAVEWQSLFAESGLVLQRIETPIPGLASMVYAQTA